MAHEKLRPGYFSDEAKVEILRLPIWKSLLTKTL